MTDDLVITPGGARHRDLVRRVPPGAVLDGAGGRHRLLDPHGRELSDFGSIELKPADVPLMPGNVTIPPPTSSAIGPAVQAPALGSGWITYAYWNRPSTPISSFRTTWVVPPAPTGNDNQLVYLFNGLQSSTMILQPVLQWGNNGAFGGNYWCIASWYADGQGGPAYHSNPITVHSGDTLVGVMSLTGQSPQGFSYDCSFDGIANSGYAVTNQPEMWQAVQTLEAYRMAQASDYPAGRTAMSAISIQTGSTTPDVQWTPVDAVTDTGQHTLIFEQGAAGHGEVDLWYGPGSYWTVGAGTVAANAGWTSWFSWGGSGDVGPQLVQAQPISPSGYLWTKLIGESRDANGHLTYWASAQNQGSTPVAFQWRGGGR